MKRILLLIQLIPTLLFAQEMQVNGVVRSESLDETLPGATVQLKGTETGTITNIDGEFSIMAERGDVLIVSFIGMQTQEIIVDKPTITVSMQEDINQLDEVTVVSQGYFDVNKEAVNGSIAQVGAEQLEKIRGNSIESILQGQVAGVVVSQSSEPGGGVGINIRGSNSLLGGTQPLYVVDGIPINPSEDAQGNGSSGQSQSSLNFLNPNDIEKIEVMKDAAASALYGARGANGVVLITTKTGGNMNGSHKFEVTVDQTLSTVNNKIDVLNGPQYENYMNQRRLNQLYIDITDPNRAGMVFDGTQELNSTNFPELENLEIPYPQTTGISTDWQDITYRMAHSNALNVAYRGGNPDGNINISLGYLGNEGVIVNSDFNRVTFGLNASANTGRGLKIYSKTNMARAWGNSASTGNGEIFQQRGIVSQTLQFQPIFDRLEPGEDDDVYAELNEGNIVSNPYTLAKFLVDDKASTNLLQSLSAVYKINRSFTATVKGAFNFQRNTRDMYYPTNTTRGRRNDGEASQAYFDRMKGYLEGNIRFAKNIRKHHFDAIAIGTYEQTNDRRLFSRAFGFGSDATAYYNFQSATDILVPVTIFNEFSLLSGLGRVGYNFKKKYFIDINGRVDASSKFAANQKAAFFPSVSLGWIASKESFISNFEQISYMKVRASYGQTGSNPIAPFQSLSLLSPIRYNFNNTLTTGYFEENLSNPDLTWETTEQYNLGVDLNLFEAKVRIIFDTYLKNTKNLLQLVRLPASNGYDQIIDNFGEIQNSGFDLSVSTEIVSSKDFQWNSVLNFSRNRNKLVTLNSSLDFQLGPSIGFSNAQPILFMEGKPLGIFWGAQVDGIYKDWEEANASGISGAAPGEIRYVNNNIDLDENGEPLATQIINFDDFVQIGDPNPDFTVALGNNFSYGNWDLNLLVTGQKGGDIFWVDSWQMYGLQKANNVMVSAFNSSWRAPFRYTQGDESFVYDPSFERTSGVENPAPVMDPGQRVIPSERQIFDGSFIRLKNVNLGYTMRFKDSQNMRIYFSGINLLTATKYPGYDPETETYNKNPQRRGVDFGTYPGTRSFILGLNFNF